MYVLRSTKFIVLALAVILSLLFALPTFAAVVTGTVSAYRSNCTIFITVTASETATYYVNIWDDGTIVQDIPAPVTTGIPTTVAYNIANAADTGAPGIGIYFGTTPTNGGGSDTLDLIDPFFYPFPCTPAVCNVVIPAGAVVGSLPNATQAYWAPGKISPDVVLNAGTYWVVGLSKDDAGNPYYEIILACQYLYVPEAAMGPSYQAPWSGQPLPTNAAS